MSKLSGYEFDVVVVERSTDEWIPRIRSKCNSTTTRIINIDNRRNGWWRTTAITDLSDDRQDEGMVVYTEENFGWQKGCNLGIALSTAPYVVLCNDDITVKTEDWLEKFKEAFEADPRLGLIGPMCDDRYPQHRNGTLECPIDQDGVLADGVRWGPPGKSPDPWKQGVPTDPLHVPLSFFCVALRREVIEDVGYLDERFRYGYGGDDNDYQWRAHLNGWKIGVHTGVNVEHEGSASYGRERRDREQPRNEILLREKWNMEIPDHLRAKVETE